MTPENEEGQIEFAETEEWAHCGVKIKKKTSRSVHHSLLTNRVYFLQFFAWQNESTDLELGGQMTGLGNSTLAGSTK